MDDQDDDLAKFHPMESMRDRDFVLYGITIIARTLQSLLDEWLPVKGGSSNYNVIDDPFWDFIANLRVCEAMELLDEKLVDELALHSQLAGLFVSKPRSKLASKRVTEIVNRLSFVQTLDRIVADGDPEKLHIGVLQLNLGSTRDRFRMAVRMLDSNLLDISIGARTTAFRRFNSKSPNVPDLSELDKGYRSALHNYEKALQQAINFSRQAGNRPSETSRIFWASILLTRLCNFGASIARLAPGSSYSDYKADRIWDNSAVATLARAAFECFLLFYYLGIEEVPDDEWAARQNLTYLHDATMRLRVFHHADADNDPAHAFYSQQREILLTKLDGSAYFQSLSERRRAQLRKGRDLFFLSQDEIIAQFGWDQVQVRRFYEFLSAHVHSLPVAFYKAMEEGDGRGRGVENDPEKSYLAQTLQFLADVLNAATELYRALSAPYLPNVAAES